MGPIFRRGAALAWAAVVLLLGATFAIDRLAPAGVAAWMPYVVPLVAAALLLLERRRIVGTIARLRSENQRLIDTSESAVLALDTKFRVTQVNRKCAAILGRTPEDVVGRSFPDDLVPSEARAEVVALLERVVRGDAPPDELVEGRLLTAGGGVRVLSWHISVLREGGDVVGVLASGTDVTERRETRDALKRYRKELEDMKYALDRAAIVDISDADGRIVYVNDRFVEATGFGRDELLGEDHRVLSSGRHPKAYIGDLWATIRGGRVWRGELCNRTRAGGSVWLDTTIVPFLDADGRPYQYLAIRFDVTARRRAEEQIREQTALVRLGEMAAIVAHEVKNPIAGISGALQILQGRFPDGGQERRVVQDIQLRLQGLDASISDMLEFARPRSLRFTRIGLQSLLRDTASLAQRDKALNDVRVTFAGDDAEVHADPALLREAFLNLLINGAQAMGGKGEIRVTTRSGPGWCRVEVEDDGPGIPADIQDKIFEPFFTTKTRGTGLGLAIVRRTVEAHGGRIEHERPPRGGTRMVVHLPADARELPLPRGEPAVAAV